MKARNYTRRWLLAILPLLPLVTGSCSADVDELDACYRMAGAYCARASRCGNGDVEVGDCKRALGDQCLRAGDLKVGNPDNCAGDLAQDCTDTVPNSCTGLEHDMGCDQCSGVAPKAQAVTGCCALAPLSAVCGGC
jgi:hypothetical protein